MALFGPQARLNRCLWWADLASWPNPDSPRGQARRENCFDQNLGRVGGSAPLVNMVVDQKGPSTTLVNNGNGRFATAGTAPVQAERAVTHISPVVGLPARMILPPAEGAPGTDKGATGPEFPYIWVLILAVVAFIIYKS